MINHDAVPGCSIWWLQGAFIDIINKYEVCLVISWSNAAIVSEMVIHFLFCFWDTKPPSRGWDFKFKMHFRPNIPP